MPIITRSPTPVHSLNPFAHYSSVALPIKPLFLLIYLTLTLLLLLVPAARAQKFHRAGRWKIKNEE